MSDKEIRETHPSYGMVGLSRVQHSHKTKLFGSSLDRHYSTITLSIRRGERIHRLGYDRFHASDEIIEIELSAAQFAEFVTTPNVGFGVPCTIRHLNNQMVEDPPDDAKAEVDMVRDGFKDNMKQVAKRLDALMAMGAKLEKSAPTAAERKALAEEIRMARQEIASNLPFMYTQFEEATSRVTSAAKAEVDAFATHAIVTTGLNALKKMQNEQLNTLEPDIKEQQKLLNK